MATVRIVEADSIAWQPVHEAVAPEVAARILEFAKPDDVQQFIPKFGAALKKCGGDRF